MKIGMVGYGYWGRNILRNLINLLGVDNVVLCDTNPTALNKACETYRGLVTTERYDDLLRDDNIVAITVVTPVEKHFPLGIKALQAGKHLFVEKPMTATVSEAEQLVEEAEKRNLVLMVGHTFLFTGAVRKLKEYIDNDEIGNIYYFDSTRINLGLFQHDINVIWDLAPHDLSIMNHLITQQPIKLAAHGMSHFGNGLENIAYVTVYFDNMIAHFNVNWLSPVKIRQTVIAGSKKMIVWDDLLADEKIKVYDKGIDVTSKEEEYKMLVNYRVGTAYIPVIDNYEALREELSYFVNCIVNKQKPFNDGISGLEVVKLLEASSQSLISNGKEVFLK